MVLKRPFYEFATREDSPWYVSLRRIGYFLWVTIGHEDYAGGTWENDFLVEDEELHTALTAQPTHEDGKVHIQVAAHRSCDFTNGVREGRPAYDYTYGREDLVLPESSSQPFQFLKEAFERHLANLPEEAWRVNGAERLYDQAFMLSTAGHYTPPSFMEMFTVRTPEPDHGNIRIDFKMATDADFHPAYIPIMPLILWLLYADRLHSSTRAAEQWEILVQLADDTATGVGLDPRVIGTLKKILLG